uniref:Uncharacterized protein n=1 Tax=Lactuca sativa TaxID=4236 RepID=A0A9R1XM40_LACSA|nr:hypothetical protein LSAT_V11C200051170 [Lactuca sativa]
MKIFYMVDLEFAKVHSSSIFLEDPHVAQNDLKFIVDDIVHSTSEPEAEEIHDSPTAIVAEEHDYQKEDETLSAQEEDDDDLYGDVEFLKEIDFTGISDDILINIEFDLDDEEFGPFPGIPTSCLNKVDEVASSATKTRDEGNVLKILLSTSKLMEVASSQGDVTSEIPSFVSSISTSAPIVLDSTQPQTSQFSMETSQSFASLEVPTVGSAPQVFSIVTTTTA